MHHLPFSGETGVCCCSDGKVPLPEINDVPVLINTFLARGRTSASGCEILEGHQRTSDGTRTHAMLEPASFALQLAFLQWRQHRGEEQSR